MPTLAILEISRLTSIPKNWKEIVAAKAGVKRNWVTHAIRRGELKVGKKVLENHAARKER